jgi:hypothetical protein
LGLIFQDDGSDVDRGWVEFGRRADGVVTRLQSRYGGYDPVKGDLPLVSRGERGAVEVITYGGLEYFGEFQSRSIDLLGIDVLVGSPT